MVCDIVTDARIYRTFHINVEINSGSTYIYTLCMILQLLQNGCQEVRAMQLRHPRGLPGEQERPGVLPQGMLQQGQREDQELSESSELMGSLHAL